jgi:hypothetical protein
VTANPGDTPGFTPEEREAINELVYRVFVGELDRELVRQALSMIGRIVNRLKAAWSEDKAADQAPQQRMRSSEERMELWLLKTKLEDWLRANPES